MKIVGVVMVRNEDVFIRAALTAILDFCDRIIVIDTGSTDETPKIVQQFRDLYHDYCEWQLESEHDLTKTHRFVEPYIGTDTWVFGVDGDEIYDPHLLAMLRKDIRSKYFSGVFQIKGAYLHVKEFGEDTATGYVGPPSHNPTKLYNFANITEWPSDGKHSLFHPKTRKTNGKIIGCDSWEWARLRCLHMRFFRRSSLDEPIEEGRRLTPEDRVGYGSRTDRGGDDNVNEREMYRIGIPQTKSIIGFPKAPR